MAIRTINSVSGGDHTTLTAALAAASAGDTLRFQDSATYVGSVDIALANITIDCDPGCTPTIQNSTTYAIRLSAGSGGFVIQGQSKASPITLIAPSGGNCVLFNADVAGTVTNCRFSGPPGSNKGYIHGGVTVTAAVRVTGCTVVTTAANANIVYGAGWTDLEFQDCTTDVAYFLLKTNAWGGKIDRCVSRGAGFMAPAGGSIAYTGTPVVSNSRHVGTSADAATEALPLWAAAGGIKVINVHLIAESAASIASGYGLRLRGSGAGINCANLIVQGFFVNVTADNAFSPTYSDVWNGGTNYTGSATAGTGCISADPMIVGGGDYSLQPGSPCINTGTDTGVVSPALNGITRPQGSASDMGEYETPSGPRVGSLTPIDPWTSEVNFTAGGGVPQRMAENAAFIAPESYTTPLQSSDGGYEPAITSVVGVLDEDYVEGLGFITARLFHAKTTYNKTYTVEVTGALESYEGLALDVDHNYAEMVALSEPATLLSATVSADARTITVTFSEQMYGSALLVPSTWSVAGISGAGDTTGVIGSITAIGAVVTLNLSYPLTPGSRYQVTASASLYDVAGNLIDPDARSGYFLVPWSTFDAPAPEGFLASLTASTAEELANIKGAPTTRLTAPLGPTDTVILVESTIGFPTSGSVWVDGEHIPYASRRSDAFMGCARETILDPADSVAKHIRFRTLPPGYEVRDGSRSVSLCDQARRDTRLGTCSDDMLGFLSSDRGYPKPLDNMSAADLREYAQTRWYLDAGTWYAALRVCTPMLRFGERTGTDAEVVDTVTLRMPTLPAGNYHGRWIIVGGILCRVRSSEVVEGDVHLTLEDFDGPFFRAANLTGWVYDWTLLPFHWTTDHRDGRAAAIDMYLHLPGEGLPWTYIMGAPDLTPEDGRPIGGQAMMDETQSGEDYHPLYVLNPYVEEVSAIVSEIVPAATLVRCHWLAA